jgi:hypothetical protein
MAKQGKKLSLQLRCEFSQQELDDKRDRLSTALLEYDKVEDEKREASKCYTESLKALRGEMRSLSKQINCKGEDRAVDCFARFHDPSIGFKTFVRLDTGEVVKTEQMTDDERQEGLFEEVDQLERMYSSPAPEPTKESTESPEPFETPEADDERPDETGDAQ